MACRPVSPGHAPEGEQNGLGALGCRREARVPTPSQGLYSAFWGRGVRCAVSTPDTWPGPRGRGPRPVGWMGGSERSARPESPPVTVEVEKTL